jgi:Zn-dependent protease/CBS domain-containing protein
MRWSFRIGRFFGIDVFVHATFFLLLAWVVVASYMRTQSWTVAIDELIFVTLVFATVVLHEYGHALTARMFGVPTRDITLLPIGGVARLERMPDNPGQEFLIAIAGPAVNVVLAGLCGIWALLDGTLAESIAQATAPETQGDVVHPLVETSLSARLLGTNLLLVIFNLIPAFPMDGGRVLRALLAMSINYVDATRIAAAVGQFLALLFGFLGLISGNFILIFIALFVWIGAAQEAEAVVQRSALAGVPVRQAMITTFEAVTPLDTLDRVAARILDGFQTDFPVVEAGRVVGMLTRNGLLTALARSGLHGRVADVMTREFLTARPDEPLDEVLLRLQKCECRSLPVLDGEHLVGMITSENIGEYLMIRFALEERRPFGVSA